MSKIILQNLNKYYYRHQARENHVINNTSLELPDQGLVCLLGESGSGKTTLLNVMGGIDKADSGKIIVDGQLFDYKKHKGEEIRCNKFAYIFQNYYLISSMTVYENLTLALEPYHLSNKEIKERIDYVLEKVGLIRFKSRNIKNLSGGQIQRIAIARALIKSPDIIFADEPTGNLDEATTLEIMMILKKISKTCLVVIATHEKQIAEFFADRIINIENGKIIGDHKIDSINRVYDDFDDNNIYLQEYQKEDITSNNNNISIYSNDETNLKLKVIHDHNKYYIVGNDIEILDQNSSIKIIDSKRPTRTTSDVDSFEYDLNKISSKNTGTLSFKDFFIKVFKSSMKKGFKIMIITMLLISALFVLGVGDYQTLSQDMTSKLVTGDTRSVSINFTSGTSLDTAVKRQYIEEFVNTYPAEEFGDEIIIRNSITGNLEYSGFTQVESMNSHVETIFNEFSYMPINYLDESSLIYGRMPENALEVVIDRWVLEKYMGNNSIAFQSLTNVKDFLGLEFLVSRRTIRLKIVGICESNNMSVYLDKYTLISCGSYMTKFASLDTLKSYYSNLDDIELKDDEIILKENDYFASFSSMKICNNSLTFKNQGTLLPESFPYDYVITEAGYKTVSNYLITLNSELTILTNNYERVKEYVNSIMTSDDPKYTNVKKLQIEVSNAAIDTMREYNEENNSKILARSIILLSMFAICLVSLFITMKAHANENMESIMVYRLLGIKRRAVALLSVVEVIAISLIVMIPSSLILIFIFKFVTMLPGVTFEFIFTPKAYLLSISAVILINALVGILPVLLILRKTPAELVSKYDI